MLDMTGPTSPGFSDRPRYSSQLKLRGDDNTVEVGMGIPVAGSKGGGKGLGKLGKGPGGGGLDADNDDDHGHGCGHIASITGDVVGPNVEHVPGSGSSGVAASITDDVRRELEVSVGSSGVIACTDDRDREFDDYCEAVVKRLRRE